MGNYLNYKIEFLNKGKFDLREPKDGSFFQLDTVYFMQNLNNDALGDSFDWMFHGDKKLVEGIEYDLKDGSTKELVDEMTKVAKSPCTQKIFYYTFDKFEKLILTLYKEYFSKEIYKKLKEEQKHDKNTTVPGDYEYKQMWNVMNDLYYIYINLIHSDIDTETCRIIFYLESV